MATKCFVCGKRIGLFSPSAKTADAHYICLDDINKFFNISSNKISRQERVKLHNIESQDILDKLNEDKQKHDQIIQEFQTVPLSEFATKVHNLHLQKNEYGYWACNDNIEWQEERSKTSRINYGGLTGTIHIARGLNYRLGSIKPDIQKTTYLKNIFNGLPLLTNKRIIVANQEGIKAYMFRRILRTIPYSDGVVLCAPTGKQTILSGFTGDNGEIFNIMLDRLLTEDDVLPGKK